MAYTHREGPYNYRRHNKIVAYRTPSSSQPTTNVLSRPHAMHPNLQKLRIDPPVLLLLVLGIVALLLWLSYGLYMSVTWYIQRLRTVRYGLEENMTPDILMAKLGGMSYSSEENGRRQFGHAVKWPHAPPRKAGDAKFEHAWTGNTVDVSRNQSISSGNALVMSGDNCKRSSGLGYRRKSAV